MKQLQTPHLLIINKSSKQNIPVNNSMPIHISHHKILFISGYIVQYRIGILQNFIPTPQIKPKPNSETNTTPKLTYYENLAQPFWICFQQGYSIRFLNHNRSPIPHTTPIFQSHYISLYRVRFIGILLSHVPNKTLWKCIRLLIPNHHRLDHKLSPSLPNEINLIN